MSLDWDVPPFWALNIARVLEARTGSAAAALDRAGLPATFLTSPPDRIAVGKEVALLDEATAALGGEREAARIGLAYDPRRTSLLSYLLLNAQTLKEGVALAERFVRVERRRAVFTSRVEGEEVMLIIDVGATGMRDNPPYIEHALGTVLSVLRIAVDTDLTPRRLTLAHQRPTAFEADLAALFGAPVASGRGEAALVFDRSVLSAPLADPDTVLLPHLTAHAQSLLDGMAATPGALGAKVRAEIAGRLSHGTPTKDQVAAALGMSARTLSRHLADEGSSFEALLSGLRRELAERYLQDRGLGLAQIAHMLGYADQAGFTSAYKRWTGRTPGAARPR
ncbi:helix-turn-helix transcriptional regulator [Chachezhania sediminis]|uniref:helix-turn-helix transcriptional regulator n=1 Tax=Chachezhania sediminis TaxID=2599291 RepID=UPI00131AE6CC|nr:AraC family transcriptional regulator [Chachezhania sediminis]